MPETAHSPRSAPASVRTAALLTYALVAIAAVRLLLAIVANDSLVEAYADSMKIDMNDELGRASAEQGAPGFVAIALISFVIFGALSVLLAQLFLRGSNGARWIAIVLGVLGGLGGILALAAAAPVWYQALGVLSGVISLAIVFYLLRPDAKAFYAS